MNWEPVDNYCERLGPGLWAEPVNAITNLCFIVAAYWAWRIVRGDRPAEMLCLLEVVIGLSSLAFHTWAVPLTGALDSLSILVFIVAYIYLATGRVLGLGRTASALAAVGFIPGSILLAIGLARVVGPLNGSVAYLPVLLLIPVYAALARDRATAAGLLVGAAILAASLTFRTIDDAICGSLPLGTHFLWHILNGIMLAHMIVVLHRADLAERAPAR